MSDTTDRDYIAELQARVGCPHEYSPDILLCNPPKRSCALCDETFDPYNLPIPAPDCSTLYGSMRAAAKENRRVRVSAQQFSTGVKFNVSTDFSYSVWCDNERDTAAAVCRMAIEELERREAANEPKP